MKFSVHEVLIYGWLVSSQPALREVDERQEMSGVDFYCPFEKS